MKDADTGGELNFLNGRMGISSSENSVPVIKLINIHKPRSYEELESLIEFHYTHDCDCGVKSKGTVRDFGRNLYEAQLEVWGEYRFSLEDCIQWEYDLFIKNSLKGNLMEDKAVEELKSVLDVGFCVRNSSGFVDEFYRVDVEVFFDNVLVCGVQVKPFSYVFMGEDIHKVNVVLNSGYCVDVFYLFYDDDCFFMNLDIVVCDILGLVGLRDV